jgi:hypothetical protein
MTSRSSVILVFAIAFAAFFSLPAILGQPFPPYPLMHWGDVVDLFTPLVLIPLYWLLLRDASGGAVGAVATVVFLLLAALWVEGQGMHLSANSISNLLGAGTTDVHELVYFYDEVLSHYIWHFAIIGLSVLPLVFAGRAVVVAGASVRWAAIVPASILYGLTYFLAVAEGQTVPLGLPAAALIVLWLLLGKRRLARSDNLVAFFLVGYGLAVVVFTGWYLYFGCFAEPMARTCS